MQLRLRYALIYCMLFLSSYVYSQSRIQPVWSSLTSEKIWSPFEQKYKPLKDDGRLQVIILLSTECPMCISYSRTIEALNQQYASQINFYGVFPGRTYSDKQVNEFVSSYKLTIPVFIDPKMKLTKLLRAEVTPEAFLFDSSGTCIYRGAIYNWLVEIGKKKIKADEYFLQNAIEQTLRGEQVAINFIKAQGCLLNEY